MDLRLEILASLLNSLLLNDYLQVCPVCAENLGRDMIGHFTVQHAHMLKVRVILCVWNS